MCGRAAAGSSRRQNLAKVLCTCRAHTLCKAFNGSAESSLHRSGEVEGIHLFYANREAHTLTSSGSANVLSRHCTSLKPDTLWVLMSEPPQAVDRKILTTCSPQPAMPSPKSMRGGGATNAVGLCFDSCSRNL